MFQLTQKMRAFRRSRRGAALVEYMLIVTVLAISIPAVARYGEIIPRLFENPGPFAPTELPRTVEIPACVMTAQCPPPPEVFADCMENTAEGQICDLIPYVPIPPYLVPIVADPNIQWAVTERNEDFAPRVFANSHSDTAANNEALLNHPYEHPSALYCRSRGGELPAMDVYASMAPFMDTLNLRGIYHSSSQYWAAGHYNPPPVLYANNYVRTFDFDAYKYGGNAELHGAVTHSKKVRCVYSGEQ